MVRIPGPSDVLTLLQQQAEAFATLPQTLAGVERTMRNLLVAVNSAQETALAMQRTAVRADKMLAELEEPIAALMPGLRRLAVVLDNPVIDTIPETMTMVNEQIIPLVESFAETQQRVARIAASTERLTKLVDEVQSGLGTLPGASFFSRVRPPWAGAAGGEAPEAAGEAEDDASASS